MKNINKGRVFLLSLLIICFLVPSLAAGGKKEEAPASAPEKKATPLTETVVTAEAAAVVNGSVITIDEVERQTSRARQQYAAQGMVLQDEQLNMVRQDVLDSLVEQRIMVLAASDAGYSADPARVEAELSQIRSQFPSEEEMTAAMEAQGMTLESLTRDIEEFLTIQDFMDKEFYSVATASDKDAQVFYDENPGYFEQPEQVQASHILIMVEPEADEAARDEAAARMAVIQDRLAAGEDFAALAGEVSECPSSAQGGDLGFFGRGAMVPEFEMAAFALQVGQVSDVVESSFGLHLIKLTDRQESVKMGYPEVAEDIKLYLAEQKAQELVMAFLEEKRAAAKVEILMEFPSAE